MINEIDHFYKKNYLPAKGNISRYQIGLPVRCASVNWLTINAQSQLECNVLKCDGALSKWQMKGVRPHTPPFDKRTNQCTIIVKIWNVRRIPQTCLHQIILHQWMWLRYLRVLTPTSKHSIRL